MKFVVVGRVYNMFAHACLHREVFWEIEADSANEAMALAVPKYAEVIRNKWFPQIPNMYLGTFKVSLAGQQVEQSFWLDCYDANEYMPWELVARKR